MHYDDPTFNFFKDCVWIYFSIYQFCEVCSITQQLLISELVSSQQFSLNLNLDCNWGTSDSLSIIFHNCYPLKVECDLAETLKPK